MLIAKYAIHDEPRQNKFNINQTYPSHPTMQLSTAKNM
jgi:hypothetical protein